MAKIGVFDSGLGGLSIVDGILKNLKKKHKIIYFGDTAHLPYGNKSPETVKKLTKKACDFLIEKEADIIVIACNTASSIALPYLSEIYKIPIIGVVNSGADAALSTKKTNIGIIGTYNTINSKKYEKILLSKNPKLKIYEKACPLFVPLVEEGIIEGKITDLIIEMYLKELKNKIEVLILGCTHYPALYNSIDKFFESEVILVDASSKIAEYIRNYNLKEENKISLEFYVSDRAENFKKMSKLFLDRNINNVEIVNI